MAAVHPDVPPSLVAGLEAFIPQAKLLPDATGAAIAYAAVDELAASPLAQDRWTAAIATENHTETPLWSHARLPIW